MITTIAEGTIAAGTVILSKYDPETITAGVEGKVSDPRFRMHVFVGHGVVVDTTISLEGADLGFDIDSAGKGRADVDEKALAAIQQIWGMSNINEEQRKTMISEFITGWIKENVKIAPANPAPAN